jgi:hypothetical protein
MQKTSTPPRYGQTKADKEVDRMLKNWNMVRCKRCGRMINMLTSEPLPNGQGFVCKGGCR